MKKKISDIKFKGTKEQEKQLKQEINILKQEKNPLIMILHKAEDIYGYLPYEIMELISKELKVSINEVYSVATFYTSFHLSMSGKYKIGICLGTACYIKGNDKVLQELEKLLGIKDGECTKDGKFSIDTTRCLGCCGMAPVISINDDIYGNVKVNELKSILDKYK